MILPQSFLNTIAYYEETAVDKNGEHHTHFTLHFKQWWKVRRVIKIRWTLAKIDGYTQTWRETQNIVELRDQLKKHFAVNQQGWAATL